MYFVYMEVHRCHKGSCLRMSPYFSIDNAGVWKVWVSHFMAYSQYVLVSSPLCGHLTRYWFLFKILGLEFVVLSLWGALSDERSGLSFVSHSLVICLCVHLLLTFLCFAHIYLYLYNYMYCIVYVYIYIYIYTLYNTYNIYKASFSPGSVQQIMPYYSLVAHATTAV
jgi:hypothetical protein